MSAPSISVETLLADVQPREAIDWMHEALRHAPAMFDRLVGSRPHRSAVHRLMASGRLEFVTIGGTRYTSLRAVATCIANSRGTGRGKKAGSASTRRRPARSAQAGQTSGGAS